MIFVLNYRILFLEKIWNISKMQEAVRKLFTLVFVRDLPNRRLLLGYKKRGFGANKWNGLGGKVEKGETIIEGAKRLPSFT